MRTINLKRRQWIFIALLLLLFLAPSLALAAEDVESSTINMLDNIIETVNAWWDVIFVLGYILGLGLAGYGVYALGSRRTQQQGYAIPVASLIFATMLINLESTISIISTTFFAENAFGITPESGSTLSYEPDVNGDETAERFVKTVIYLTIFLGLIFTIIGLFKGRKAVSQSGDSSEIGRALIHIIAGVFCMNIVPFAQIFGNSIGGFMETTIHNILPD